MFQVMKTVLRVVQASRRHLGPECPGLGVLAGDDPLDLRIGPALPGLRVGRRQESPDRLHVLVGDDRWSMKPSVPRLVLCELYACFAFKGLRGPYLVRRFRSCSCRSPSSLGSEGTGLAPLEMGSMEARTA